MDPDLLRKGKEYYQAKNFAEARKIFIRLIESSPNDSEAWIWMASVAKNRDDAITFLQKANSLNPNDQRIIKYLSQMGVAPAEQPLFSYQTLQTPLERLNDIASGQPTRLPIDPITKPFQPTDSMVMPAAATFSDYEKHLAIEKTPTPQGQQSSQSEIKSEKIPRNNNKIFWRVIICAVFLVLIAASIFAYRSFRETEKFKTNLSVFIKEADKLEVMTNQGVTNNDFSNQLAEVKAAYIPVISNYPPQFAPAKNNFDIAITFWDGTLQFWQMKFDSYEDCYITDEELIKTIGGEYSIMNCDDAISYSMTSASDEYMSGRGLISDLLK